MYPKRLIGLTYYHPLILIGQTVRKARITTKLPLAIDMWLSGLAAQNNKKTSEVSRFYI